MDICGLSSWKQLTAYSGSVLRNSFCNDVHNDQLFDSVFLLIVVWRAGLPLHPENMHGAAKGHRAVPEEDLL